MFVNIKQTCVWSAQDSEQIIFDPKHINSTKYSIVYLSSVIKYHC